MIDSRHRPGFGRFFLAAVFVGLWLLGANATAAPGAHGPNGEHLDGPASAGAAVGGSAPRMEARTETFELVGTLRADEFSMLINRFETNEPVLDAKVEVESGSVKAVAKFHADLGDFSVDDPAFLKALQAPGEHGLVITVMAGAEADLLEGTLKNGAATAGDHGHAPGDSHGRGLPLTAWLAIGLLAVGALIYLLSRGQAAKTGAAP